MTSQDQSLEIGSLLFEDLDQIDLTGPFEHRKCGGEAAWYHAPLPGLTAEAVRDINLGFVVIWPAGLQPRKISR